MSDITLFCTLQSNMVAFEYFFLFLLGCIAGIFGALLGLGGGIFLIPAMTLLLNIPMHTAVATSIVAVIATSTAGATMNLERSIVHIRLAMILEVATVAGALIGGIMSNALSGFSLAKIFGVLLLLVALLIIFRLYTKNNNQQTTNGILSSSYYDEATGKHIYYSVQHLPLSLIISFIAGNVSGLLGVGGGIFKVPAMHVGSKIPIKVATATSNFMIGVTAAASAFIYLTHGHIHPIITSLAALGVLCGSLIGVAISKKIHSTILTWLFIIVLLFVATQLLTKDVH